jgi:hypothetical protein
MRMNNLVRRPNEASVGLVGQNQLLIEAAWERPGLIRPGIYARASEKSSHFVTCAARRHTHIQQKQIHYDYCGGPNLSRYSIEFMKPLTIVRKSVGCAVR